MGTRRAQCLAPTSTSSRARLPNAPTGLGQARPTSRLGRMTAGTPAIQAVLSTSHRTRRSRSPCARRRWRARPARAETRALHPSSSPWRRWRREPSRRARRVSRVLWVFCRRAAPALPDAPTSLEGLRSTRGGPCGRAVAATGSSQRAGARWWPEETAREPSRWSRSSSPSRVGDRRHSAPRGGVNLPDAPIVQPPVAWPGQRRIGRRNMTIGQV